MKGYELFLVIWASINLIAMTWYWIYLCSEFDQIPIVCRIFKSEELNMVGKITFSILFVLVCLPTLVFTWTIFGVFYAISWLIIKLFFKKEKENDNTRNN